MRTARPLNGDVEAEAQVRAARGSAISRQQNKCTSLQGSDGSKGSLIEGQQMSGAITESQHGYGEIREPEIERREAIVQRQRQPMFWLRQAFDAEPLGSQIVKELSRGARAATPAE